MNKEASGAHFFTGDGSTEKTRQKADNQNRLHDYK